MSRTIRRFPNPRRAVIGTLGLPGERVFYFQVEDDRERISLRMEKQQAATLAEQLHRVLATLTERGISSDVAPERDDDPLVTPLEEEFVTAFIGLAWDDAAQAISLEFHALDERSPADFGDDSEDAPDTVRVWLTPTQGRGFADRALAVVAAGRPPCPLCQLPLDPQGHVCPRANGYRRQLG